MAKILIVEDDPLMSRMYQKIFTFEKYEVEMAGNGQEGLDKARSVKPTLIMLDVMMPIMNGLEVLDKLKSDPETRATPVIMLTNLAGQQDAETALAKGAVKYIIKSEHDPKQVSDMVKEVLAGYDRNAIPSAAPAAPMAPAPAPPQPPAPAPVVDPAPAPAPMPQPPTPPVEPIATTLPPPPAPAPPAPPAPEPPVAPTPPPAV
jgi:CheY-like chemotaxis protein